MHRIWHCHRLTFANLPDKICWYNFKYRCLNLHILISQTVGLLNRLYVRHILDCLSEFNKQNFRADSIQYYDSGYHDYWIPVLEITTFKINYNELNLCQCSYAHVIKSQWTSWAQLLIAFLTVIKYRKKAAPNIQWMQLWYISGIKMLWCLGWTYRQHFACDSNS